MNERDVANIFDRANASFENAGETHNRVAVSTERADNILARIDQKSGAVTDARRRELKRLNSGIAQTLVRVAITVGVISLAAIGVGLVIPIGMFGFLAAVGLAIGVAAMLIFSGGKRALVKPNVTPDLPNGTMVQRFDSYLYRSRALLPAPAQAEIDQLAQALPPLKLVLERIPDLDPAAQDARRLMSVHLPTLVDRYLHVPAAYRDDPDGEGKTPDQRLVEALAAGREALSDISDRLAKGDLAAFETHGRFIESRYKDATSFDRPGGDR
ncbi:MAG TPA: hypothetical protein VGR05_01820 [Sphingomicrobium sp.]|nr:hypothetical protein [Sphingomicrobium sp.]